MATKVTLNKEQKKEKAARLLPITSFLQDYRESLGDGSKEYRGIPSGFKEIDDRISGLDRFILLAGRSGAGKTTLALQLALGVAQQGTPVLIYSLEMGRDEVITKLVQGVAHTQGNQLFANTIDLNGNNPNLDNKTKERLTAALDGLETIGQPIYIRDSSQGIPPILDKKDGNGRKTTQQTSIYRDILDIKVKHKVDRVLVLIDSVQDIVPENSNQTQAEVKTLGDLTELQQSTDATLLVTAQKNKSSVNSSDDYGDVMGSMSYIHKPNTVLMLNTAREMLKGKGKGNELTDTKKGLLKDINEFAKSGKYYSPVGLKVLKGRFTGTASLSLTYYGAFGYFTADEPEVFAEVYKDFQTNY